MLKKSRMILLCGLAVGMLPSLALAELKVGVVNTERILKESAPAVRAAKKLEKEFAAREQEIQKLSKQFREVQSHLERENITMSETERRNKERDAANLNRDLQRAQREFREDLNLRQNEERAQFQERVTKTINDFAEREKFDLIIQEAVYISQRLDITEKVLKALADK